MLVFIDGRGVLCPAVDIVTVVPSARNADVITRSRMKAVGNAIPRTTSAIFHDRILSTTHSKRCHNDSYPVMGEANDPQLAPLVLLFLASILCIVCVACSRNSIRVTCMFRVNHGI